MPRYFLNQRYRGELIEDPDGAEFPDIQAVRKEALLAAREIMSDRLRSGQKMDHSSFEITDEHGRLILQVPFTEALPHSEQDEP